MREAKDAFVVRVLLLENTIHRGYCPDTRGSVGGRGTIEALGYARVCRRRWEMLVRTLFE